MEQKTFELLGVKITLKRLTHGDKLNRSSMIRKFIKLADNASVDEREIAAAQYNFIITGKQTAAWEGIDYEPPHLADSEDEFEAKFQRFLAVDDGVIERWIEEVDALTKSTGERALAPTVELTDKEKKDPNF